MENRLMIDVSDIQAPQDSRKPSCRNSPQQQQKQQLGYLWRANSRHGTKLQTFLSAFCTRLSALEARLLFQDLLSATGKGKCCCSPSLLLPSFYCVRPPSEVPAMQLHHYNLLLLDALLNA
jgi:hypothetical protein